MRSKSAGRFEKEAEGSLPGTFGAIRMFWNALAGISERQESRQRVESLSGAVRILVVCYGNICRSPVVEILLREQLPTERFRIRSCGLLPREGSVPPEEYADQARCFGIDLSGHRSRYISKTLVEWSNLIVIMDRRNLDLLQEFGAAAIEKSVWLGAWDPEGPLEIPDPFGRSPEEMRTIIGRMGRSSLNLVRSLSPESSPSD